MSVNAVMTGAGTAIDVNLPGTVPDPPLPDSALRIGIPIVVYLPESLSQNFIEKFRRSLQMWIDTGKPATVFPWPHW